jgi:predicted nucleotide-binding protein
MARKSQSDVVGESTGKVSKAEQAEQAEKASGSRVSQSDVPSYSLEQALRIARAIHENYADRPTAPLRVASAMNVQPSSSAFRMLCGAAIAYELTEGGAKAPEIKITALGKRIVRPITEGDDLAAKREAILKPRVVREFLTHYHGSQLPKDNIAQNVLNDMGVPSDRTSEVLALIVESAEALGMIREIKGKRYVDLNANAAEALPQVQDDSQSNADENSTVVAPVLPVAENPGSASPLVPTPDTTKLRRVFITHGKNKEFVEPIRQLLAFGEMEAIVSVEKQSVSQPVPEKVMNDMRACGAAIIHVEDEMRLMDKDAVEHVVLNPNVLIEIGAAMALYNRRFILLVKDGVKLPSNLQGLFEVRYSGATLDGNATIRLLQAINEMKKTGS